MTQLFGIVVQLELITVPMSSRKSRKKGDAMRRMNEARWGSDPPPGLANSGPGRKPKLCIVPGCKADKAGLRGLTDDDLKLDRATIRAAKRIASDHGNGGGTLWWCCNHRQKLNSAGGMRTTHVLDSSGNQVDACLECI